MKTLNSKLAVMAAIVLSGSLPALATIGFTTSDSINYTATAGNVSGSGTALSTVIPDNNESGVAYGLNFAATGLTINPGSVQVTLNISGGYNGDLTVYLSHGAGIAYLMQMNQAVSGSGLNNVVFNTTAGGSVPTGGSGALTGSYLPASGSLTAFNDANPNGAWTLFFADRSPSDLSTLNGFSVSFGTTITPVPPVPEPVNVALGVFGGLLVVGGFVRNRAAVGKAFNFRK
ncbi:MAG: proprotein convertase P-domain-containing protein [Verrucomicrobiae bacterium]